MTARGQGGPRVAVVGGGLIGASIAYHLALAGARVTVIEREAGPPTAETSATAGSFAWINASAGSPSPYYELRLQALLEWRALEAALGGALPLRWGGSLEWHEDPAVLERELREQETRGYPVRAVGRDEIRALEPAIAEPPERAAYAALEGSVEPLGASAALLAAAERLGAEVRRGQAATPELVGGRAAVTLDGGRLAADVVVLAAGTGTEDLAAALGVALPMANRPGLLIHCEPHPPLLRRLVLSPGAHIRQDPDGRIVAGEDFGGGTVPDDPEAFAARLLARIKRRLSGAEALALERITLGVRPIPRDGRPVLGFAAAAEGLYLAVMHSGVTLAPVAGRLAAAEILGGRPLDILAPFRLARFGAG